jgi:hypothetical protein
MKKIFLLSFAVLFFSFLSQAQFKLGVKAGINDNNQRLNVSEGSVYSGDRLKGFHAGLVGDIDLGRNFYLQPQLLFTRKGAEHLSSTGASATKVRLNYVEMPVNLVCKFGLPFGKIVVGTGATYSYAIGGKAIQQGTATKLFSEGSAWNRQDLSLNFTAGLEFNNGLFISANSQKGLLDIYKAGNTSVKNKSMSLSVGYLIDWKKLARKA